MAAMNQDHDDFMSVADGNGLEADFEDPGPIVRKRPPMAEMGGQPAAKRMRQDGGADISVSITKIDDPHSLFKMVKTGRSACQSLVDDWIERYKTDRDCALIELINFFVQTCGCKGVVTQEMYSTMEHSEIIRKLTEEFDEESGDYPLIMSGPVWKKFKSNFIEFVIVLVRQCQYSIIFDQYLMDNVISWLTALSDSQVRAFRHTSTLAAMKLMTALVNVALNLSINLDKMQRQYESERQKNPGKRATGRLEMLRQKREELEENIEEIQNMMNNIFNGVFVHRYRDTQAELRAICMGEIGVWIKNYSGMFLNDSYLRYIGWNLHDKNSEVRLKCLTALHGLYASEELAQKLELFTNRFKERIVAMTLDKKVEVATQAVKLVTYICSFNDDILENEDSENIYQLVYSSHRTVAQAAGQFLNQRLFVREDDTKTPRMRRGKKKSANAPLIRDLVQFFIESQLHDHAAYLVDSLWEVNDMLKDWECMTDLLLEDSQRDDDALDDRQETALIDIMVCAARQAHDGQPPVGRGQPRKLTGRERTTVLDDKMKLTTHFIQTLPNLLAKYSVDAEKMANLLLLPQYFDLEIYTTGRLEKHLEPLLQMMSEIVEKHTDQEVLKTAAKTFEALCNEEFAIHSKSDIARSTLIDTLSERFKKSWNDFAEAEDPDDEDIFPLITSLKRVAAFYACHEMTPWDLYEYLFLIAKTGRENHTAIPEEVLCLAIGSLQLALMWERAKLDENNPVKENMKRLRKRLIEIMEVCFYLMSHHPSADVREFAFIDVGDLLIVFGKQLAHNAVMAPLVYVAEPHLQAQLSGFVSEHVFIQDDQAGEEDDAQKIELLHRRRNMLAVFCKLIIFNVIKVKAAADVFKHYLKYYNDYGDIIKATLAKTNENDKVGCAKTIILSLALLFKDLQDSGERLDRTSDFFNSIKDLARSFSLMFGLDQIKSRDAIATLHKEGIIFSINPIEDPSDPSAPPPNLAFLEILSEFSNKLMKQDKKTVLTYLDKHLKPGMTGHREEEWLPLQTYRNNLLYGEDGRNLRGHRQILAGRRRRGRPAKHRRSDDEGDDPTHPNTPGSGPKGPAMASTAIKSGRVLRRQAVSEDGPDDRSEGDFEYSQSRRSVRQSRRSNVRSAVKQRRRRGISLDAGAPLIEDSDSDQGSSADEQEEMEVWREGQHQRIVINDGMFAETGDMAEIHEPEDMDHGF